MVKAKRFPKAPKPKLVTRQVRREVKKSLDLMLVSFMEVEIIRSYFVLTPETIDEITENALKELKSGH